MKKHTDPLNSIIEKSNTLLEVLLLRAEHQGDRIAIKILKDGENVSEEITYAQLLKKAQTIGSQLRRFLETDDRALLLFETSIDFIAAFFGCLVARVIAVPAYAPQGTRTLHRLQAILTDANALAVLTTSNISDQLKLESAVVPWTDQIHWIEVDKIDPKLTNNMASVNVGPKDIAFLQYTSGSTGHPKGVVITHENIIANMAMIRKAMDFSADSIMVNWLPMYHDMGLIGCVLQPIYSGCLTVLMPPAAFLTQPIRWIKAITDFKATIVGGPNFAFDLCAKRIKKEFLINLDLSSLKVVFNGAEPVRFDTIEHFSKIFSTIGLTTNSFFPCYGLAEATLFVSGGPMGQPRTILELDRDKLANGLLEQVVKNTATSKAIVSCGKIADGCEVLITNSSNGEPCLDNEIGEIWISGSNVSSGYWNKPEINQNEFFYSESSLDYCFFKTGDLGFKYESELFITGRKKDIIIISGKNHYPQDIEQSIERSHLSVRAGCSAAFSYEEDLLEKVAVVAELNKAQLETDFELVRRAFISSVAREHEIPLSMIVLLPPGKIPKTSSGKIQRHLTSKLIKEGKLDHLYMWKENLIPYPPGRSKVFNGESTEILEIPRSANAAPVLPFDQSEHPSQRLSETLSWIQDYSKKRINSQTIDERRTITPHIILDLGNRGLLGMLINPIFGGPGYTHSELAGVMSGLAAVDLSVAIFVGLNNSLGCIPIIESGSISLQEEMLPLLASGRQLASFAITEEEAGSNPQAMRTSSIEQIDSSILLNGKKIWIGSASWAGVINLFSKEFRSDGSSIGISGYAIKQDQKGLSHGPEALTMGVRGMVQNEVILKDVIVTQEQRLGLQGKGMQVAQSAMNYARFGLAAICVGAMKRCINLAYRYSSKRIISTGRLSDNPVSINHMYRMTMATLSLEKTVKYLSILLDNKQNIPVELFLTCKITAPEFLGHTVDSAIQILGGRGYIEPNILPQIYRDARLLRIFEGPTETLEAHLGALMTKGHSKIEILNGLFKKSNDICARLQEDINELINITNAFANHNNLTALNILLNRQVGRISSIGLLWVMCSETTPVTEAAPFEWLKMLYEDTKGSCRRELTLHFKTSQISLNQIISTFNSDIGDIDQNLPGVDYSRDRIIFEKSNETQKNTSKGVDQSKLSEVNLESKIIIDTGNQLSPSHSRPPLEAADKDTELQKTIVELKHILSRIRRISEHEIDPFQTLTYYGLDSLGAFELVCEIEEKFKITVPESLAWDFPNLALVADFIINSKASLKTKTSNLISG